MTKEEWLSLVRWWQASVAAYEAEKLEYERRNAALRDK